MNTLLRIATRESALALWQAEHIKSQLEQLHPHLQVELVPMTSRGDQVLDIPLAKVGGKGLFVKELEQALLEHRADIAVHSMKDVPLEFPEGLGLGVICEREDPRDAWVSAQFASLEDLPPGSIVGTSSLRRQSQLLALRPDLKVHFLRGNVNTRLAKLDAGQYHGIILAAAGLIRLGFGPRIRQYLSPETSLPAGGQGAIGIEYRLADSAIAQLIAPLAHLATSQQVTAERALNRRLEGGCQVPIASFAQHKNGQLWMRALVAQPDGQVIYRAEGTAAPEDAEALGIRLAEDLLQLGAGPLLQALSHDQ